MKKVLIAFSLLFAFVVVKAQDQTLNPVEVTSEAVVSGDSLLVTIHFKVEDNWMVYDSLNGDVGPIPISFNSDGVIGGDLISISKPITKHKYDDIFEVDLWYFTKEASYTLIYKIKDASVGVDGSVSLEYMSCNLTSGVCLPPKLIDISVK